MLGDGHDVTKVTLSGLQKMDSFIKVTQSYHNTCSTILIRNRNPNVSTASHWLPPAASQHKTSTSQLDISSPPALRPASRVSTSSMTYRTPTSSMGSAITGYAKSHRRTRTSTSLWRAGRRTCTGGMGDMLAVDAFLRLMSSSVCWCVCLEVMI